MAISVAFYGTCSVTTGETSLTASTAGSTAALSAQTADGIYQCFLDLNAMTSGDTYEFKVYEKVLSTAATQRLVYSARFSEAQGTPNWQSPASLLMHGWEMSLTRIAGTNRSIDWSIRQVA